MIFGIELFIILKTSTFLSAQLNQVIEEFTTRKLDNFNRHRKLIHPVPYYYFLSFDYIKPSEKTELTKQLKLRGVQHTNQNCKMCYVGKINYFVLTKFATATFCE